MRRLPVYLLIDCSESMAGSAIETVDTAIRNMVQDLRSTPHALETVTIGVIAFSGDARLLVPLTPIDLFQMPPLTIRPGTSLGRALDMLVSCIRADVVKTTAERKGDWRPLVFLFTDGQPTDDWRGAVERLEGLTSPRIANIYAIGCGDDVDFSILHEMTDIVFKTPAADAEAIRKAFVWITSSVQSASTGVAEGTCRLPELADGSGLKQVPKCEYVPDREPRQVFIHARCSRSREDYLMRFVRTEDGGPYVATAAHKLAAGETVFGVRLPSVQSDRLAGVPACPYCGNPGAAVCGCGGAMCIDMRKPEGVVCPHCGTEQQGGFTTGNFDVRQSAG
jgi:uncharacterized protein YegL